jgi:hemoglobin
VSSYAKALFPPYIFEPKLRVMQNALKDIENKNDIKTFVDGFYGKIRQDAMLGPVFDSRIATNQWPAHLERMYDFWNAILFSEKGFQGNPMQKHLSLPIDDKHFAQWLGLFTETIDENFSGPKAEEAKKRAASIAQIMNFKIVSMRK